MRQVTEKAYGKINLSLDVTGRREDGYHLVRMVMQTLSVHDTVTITERGDGEICILTSSGQIPAGKDNLAYRAADALRRQLGRNTGFTIEIDKRIPVAAGMAGGSADAAAVLRGVNTLLGGKLSMDTLREMALPLGADIPFCVEGGCCLCEGIGEVLTRLPSLPDCAVLLAKPPIAVPTPWVYREYDALPPEEIRHPLVEVQTEALRRSDLAGVAAACGNVLELKTGKVYPVIGELENRMRSLGALVSLMTGSGPTVFGLFTETAPAEEAAEVLRDAYPDFEIICTEPIEPIIP